MQAEVMTDTTWRSSGADRIWRSAIALAAAILLALGGRHTRNSRRFESKSACKLAGYAGNGRACADRTPFSNWRSTGIADGVAARRHSASEVRELERTGGSVDETGLITARGDGTCQDHGAARRGVVDDPGHGQGIRGGSAGQLRQPGRADLHQARLQRGRMPRQGQRPERVPAQPARLRAGARLRNARQGRARPAGLPGGARSQPAAHQGDGQGAPRRRQAARSRLARISVDPPLDRHRDARRQADGPQGRADRGLSRRASARARQQASRSWSRRPTPTGRPRT